MPAKWVLIYDGDCQFCQLSLDFGIKTLGVFPEYVAFQRINPADFGLTTKQVQSQIWLIGQTGPPLGAHLAAAQILMMQTNPLWRMAGWIMKTPPFSWVAGWVYGWVAKNRHRMPGGSRECKIEDTFRG